jgi:hypothetical protein
LPQSERARSDLSDILRKFRYAGCPDGIQDVMYDDEGYELNLYDPWAD